MSIAKVVRRLAAGGLAAAGIVASGCAPADLYGTIGVTGFGAYAETPYGYGYPSPYYDSFAYAPNLYTPGGWDGPYYHLYPNLDYYLQYRPIYPG